MEANPSIQQVSSFYPPYLSHCCFGQRGVDAPKTTPYYGQAMGTTWSVQLADDPNGNVQDVIQTQLNIVNALMSTYQPDSEISRFNRSGHRTV